MRVSFFTAKSLRLPLLSTKKGRTKVLGPARSDGILVQNLPYTHAHGHTHIHTHGHKISSTLTGIKIVDTIGNFPTCDFMKIKNNFQ